VTSRGNGRFFEGGGGARIGFNGGNGALASQKHVTPPRSSFEIVR
jgi:hypothetical protein